MHIMEGFLPVEHAAAWTAASAPFVGIGLVKIKKAVAEHPERRMLLGVAAAFSFVLSALKLPSVAGSSSHPTGTGLGGIMFGPFVMAPIGLVVLLFQALLLAHGGITTLGANVFSLAVAGPFVAYAVYKACRGLRLPLGANVFAAAALADLATYAMTSLQLALAFPDAASGVAGSLAKFLSVFAVTQVPIAITEGLLTAVVFGALARFDAAVLAGLGLGAAVRPSATPAAEPAPMEAGS